MVRCELLRHATLSPKGDNNKPTPHAAQETDPAHAHSFLPLTEHLSGPSPKPIWQTQAAASNQFGADDVTIRMHMLLRKLQYARAPADECRHHGRGLTPQSLHGIVAWLAPTALPRQLRRRPLRWSGSLLCEVKRLFHWEVTGAYA